MRWYTFDSKGIWDIGDRLPYARKSDAIDDILKHYNDFRVKPNIIKIEDGFYEYISVSGYDNEVISIVREDKIVNGMKEKFDKWLK